MRFLRQSLLGLFFAVMSVGMVAYAVQLISAAVETRMNEQGGQFPGRERVFAVNVETAQLETLRPELVAFGRIESRRRLELRVPTSGRVISLSDNFVEGGTVSAGELLVQVDPADAEAALQNAKADQMDAAADARDAVRVLELAKDELASAEAQAELRARAFERQADLRKRGVGSAAAVEDAELAAAQARQVVITRRQALIEAEARLDQTSTQVLRADVALRTAQRELDDTTVIAEFSGVLEAVTLVKGRLVSANEKLADLVDPDQLDAAFTVSTSQYTRLIDEQGKLLPLPVKIELDANGMALKAKAQLQRDSGGQGQTGRLLYAQISAGHGLKPGDFVTARISEPALSGVVQVAASAYGADGAVLVIDAQDRLERLPVELIRRQGDNVLIRGAGLAGREIVLNRTPLLGEGIKITPLRKSDTKLPAATTKFIKLSAEKRAELVTFVESNPAMPEAVKRDILRKLAQPDVPMALVSRIEARMGG
ncbi:HlyD family efflux transporter periplasmic adaptor subunit [Epibacterium sp. SM1969]|uniref:HlyD family efflux transporter periplasmic adaptor subunit n=1 Tax=Tritonibacter aquimaris TaxID=2663379 RepID=A0A844AVF7_9RHOB|nr:HlyD family efflux transporter periplasmic adaptor subunit [Tritonibacter aquimaris]MQY42384.1 HlyD family efflux transporter periplasmic adaptor subunit [Tritonibacter aquimaris]